MTTEELIEESNQVIEKYPCPNGMELKTYREGIYMALIWRDKLVSDGDLADVTSRLERLDEALFHATNFLADMHNSRLKSEGEPVLTPVGFDWLTDWQELVYNESREKTMIRAASK